MNPNPYATLIERAELLLLRLEQVLPPLPTPPDFSQALAFRWQRGAHAHGQLLPIPKIHAIHLRDLHGIDEQKARLVANTRQFIAGRPANNVLLTGARGSGKSSVIKALLNDFAARGLRLIEVDKGDLTDLPQIVTLIENRPERFVVFCDDLSFDAGDASYKSLKVVLDGSLAAAPDNVLIYATSNRRHLMPEFFAENLETKHLGGEVHPGEAIEEKISLSERFGLWLSFYPFDQDHYLAICGHWMRQFGVDEAAIAAAEREALNWALGRGSRSGRVAWQFAKDFAGAHALASSRKKTAAPPGRKSAAKGPRAVSKEFSKLAPKGFPAVIPRGFPAVTKK
jgi:hypothetical protein